MHVPLPFLSIDPGERAPELGDKIVAPRVIAIPPAAGDAFRAGDQRKLGLRDPARPLEEPCRPRPRLYEVVRVPLAGLDAAPGVLRTVIGIGGDAMQRIASQTRL